MQPAPTPAPMPAPAPHRAKPATKTIYMCPDGYSDNGSNCIRTREYTYSKQTVGTTPTYSATCDAVRTVRRAGSEHVEHYGYPCIQGGDPICQDVKDVPPMGWTDNGTDYQRTAEKVALELVAWQSGGYCAHMRVAVITPVRNAASRITDTIDSVLSQQALREGAVDLLYVIQDGESTDGTAQIAQERSAGRAIVESEADSGMYDALARGFARVEAEGGADWYCYLNAGDMWHPRTLSMLSAIHAQTNEQWVCGLHSYYAQDGTLVHTRLPFRYRIDLLRAGAYGRGLPTVQQESTFWRADLQRTIDTRALADYRVAGDSYLWWTFANTCEPAIVQALLGGFRYHGGHLGVNKKEYRSEIDRFAGPLPATARLRIPAERALWEQPTRVKARFSPHLYAHSTSTGGWVSQVGEIQLESSN